MFFHFTLTGQAVKIEESNLTVQYENSTILPLYDQRLDWISSLKRSKDFWSKRSKDFWT